MIPFKQTSLAWALIFTFLVILGWMAFEGLLVFVVGVGVLLTVVWVAVGVSRFKSAVVKHVSSRWRDLILWPPVLGAVAGGLMGLLAPLVIVALMVFKTGIHSHGPEFAPHEIEWVLGQFLRWGGLGVLFGFGVGLLITASQDS